MGNDLNSNSVKLLDLRYDNLTEEEALAHISMLLAQGRKAQVCFLDLDGVREAQNDPGYRIILNDADLVLPGGGGMKLLSRFFRVKLRDNFDGLDLSVQVMQECARRGYSVFSNAGSLPKSNRRSFGTWLPMSRRTASSSFAAR